MISNPYMNFNFPMGGLSVSRSMPQFLQQIPTPQSGLFQAGGFNAYNNPMQNFNMQYGGQFTGGAGGGFNPFTDIQFNHAVNPNVRGWSGGAGQPPPGMIRNPNFDPVYSMRDDVDPPGSSGDLKRQMFIPGGTIAPGKPAPPLPENQKQPYSFTPGEGYIENPYYSDRFSGGRVGTADFQFGDQRYVTPEALKGFQDQLDPESLKIYESERYSQTPSYGGNMYAGGGNLYNPDTGRFENITGGSPVTSPSTPRSGNIFDFLFEGSAPSPGSARETSRVELPQWYTDYATDMLGRARAVAGQPYQPFPGPRIAPFTPTEREGMDMTRRGATAYQPFLGAATDILGDVRGRSGFGAAAPFLGEGAAYTRGSAGTSAMPTAERYYQEALGRTPTGAASPFVERAAGMFPGAAQEYMSPYTRGVVDELGNIGLEQLQEKFLPEIGEEFIRAGQFGGSRMGEFGARALRDMQRSVLGEQRKALESGYKTAADIYGTDASRQAELARLMGTFGGQEQQFLGDVGKSLAGIQQEDLARILRAGGQMGEFGKVAGSLGSEDLDRLLKMSGSYADIAGLAQKYGLGAGEAVTGVGARERAMQQANLELAYKDFLEQRGYPKEQVEFMARMLSGIKLPETRISETITTPAMPGGDTGIQKILEGVRGGLNIADLLKDLFEPKAKPPG